MCLLMSKPHKETSGAYENCGIQDDISKRGACLFEIRRTGMVQWGTCRQVVSDMQCDKDNPLPLSMVVKEELNNDDPIATEDSLTLSEIRRRKRFSDDQITEARASKSAKLRQSSTSRKGKPVKLENSNHKTVERWTIERYKLAEKNMFEVMKAEGAAIDNPISRAKLRMAVRKHIGDTGLLDHLLKHVDGKVAPGGTERFRRRYNFEGVMEYWLESADLVKVKREAGLLDVSAGELTLVKEEISKMKRDMEELMSRNQEQNNASRIEEMQKEMVNWRGEVDGRLTKISSYLSKIQAMHEDLVKWKCKTEQQLTEISNSLSSMQAPKQPTTLSPVTERWEDWLESSNLDNIQGEEFAPWLGSTDLINVGKYTSMQDTCTSLQPWLKPCNSSSQDAVCARELELLKEEMAKMKRDVQELVPKRTEEDQTNVTPDSSVTANSKLDLDNSFLLFQGMFQELVKWKEKMEEQVLQISNSVSILQASRPYTTF